MLITLFNYLLSSPRQWILLMIFYPQLQHSLKCSTQKRILSSLFNFIQEIDNVIHALPAWARNCYTAANDGLYRNLLGRCLGGKIEDPLLEGLAGGRGL
jgi:hypothetical protein